MYSEITHTIYDDMELFVRGFDDVLNLILGERRRCLRSKTKRLAVNHTASAHRFAAVCQFPDVVVGDCFGCGKATIT